MGVGNQIWASKIFCYVLYYNIKYPSNPQSKKKQEVAAANEYILYRAEDVRKEKKQKCLHLKQTIQEILAQLLY